MIIHHSLLPTYFILIPLPFDPSGIAERCDTTTASLPGWSVWEAALADGKQRGSLVPSCTAPRFSNSSAHTKKHKMNDVEIRLDNIPIEDSLSWFLSFHKKIGCQCFSWPPHVFSWREVLNSLCIATSGVLSLEFFLFAVLGRPIVLRSGPSLEAAATGQLAAGEVFTTAEVRDNILRLQAGQGESKDAMDKRRGDAFFLLLIAWSSYSSWRVACC